MIKGLVQGVGFRPFICRLAVRNGILGQVENRSDGVSVRIQGNRRSVVAFSKAILQDAPPASQIKSLEIYRRKVRKFNRFSISESRNGYRAITEISPDIAVCQECLNDLGSDPERIDYPFINCTNCGPRFSIIEGVPYDRPLTAMKGFQMCENCLTEYNDILDRRYHAQPVACNSCGPRYSYYTDGKTLTDFSEITGELSAKIESGNSVAVKGIGGYFLMCDALNEAAVKSLRERKQRDAKPFAVMFRSMEAVKEFCQVGSEEENQLSSWRRPIVILGQKRELAPSVSNGLPTTGAMLPYMPLHYLLFKKILTPALVFTSGNLSDEPIITDDDEASEKLLPVARSILTCNRDIINRSDDSVLRVINNKTLMIRRSRGFVPRPVDLDIDVEGIIAMGAGQKNTFCLGREKQAIMSQHIGDLDSSSAFYFYLEAIDKLSTLFRFKPACIACDLHPGYLSTVHAEKLEKELRIPLIRVQHHHAHIASCLAENSLNRKVIGVSLDGTGYGPDGNIWGGEFLIADMKSFRRYSHFDYIPMPGADKAVKEPWRMALAYLFKYFGENFDYLSLPLFRKIERARFFTVLEMTAKGVNSPLTSGAGRLFDAVSALLGLCSEETFESEAPMRLESIINCETEEYYPFILGDTIIFSEMLLSIISDLGKKEKSEIAAKFHNTVAQAILEVSRKIRMEAGISDVVLSGGVFQNKYLLEKAFSLLRKEDFTPYSNSIVPANDGGISLGQLVVASKNKKICA